MRGGGGGGGGGKYSAIHTVLSCLWFGFWFRFFIILLNFFSTFNYYIQ